MSFTQYLNTEKESAKIIENKELSEVENQELIEEMTEITALTEAKDLTQEKNGFSHEEFLQDFYNNFAEGEWTTKQAGPMKKKYGARAAGQLQINLIRWGYIDKDTAAKTFSISALGLSYLSGADIEVGDGSGADDDDDAVGTAKGVKDISKLKAKRFKVPKPGSNSKYLDQMKTVLSHMKGFASGTTKTTFMLAGDPGTGKTSFINSVSTLTGIPLVVIEAPHITQEHIINIPFLVIDGQKRKEGNLTVDTSDATKMKVVQAESNLVTLLKSKHKRTPEDIQKQINKSKPLRDIQPKIQKRVDKVKDSYNAILFLDEFYRTSSIKIRNVLRNILNGKIGNDKIPTGVYIIMATNINDDGVEDIPLNQDFHIMDYDVSSKEDFMNYMYGKYVDNPDDYDDEADFDPAKPATASGIAIKEEVWNAFMTGLQDADLGANDEDSDVRLSPRRIEQLILYINASLPVANKDEAKALLSFIKNNFTNYLTGSSYEQMLQALTLQTKQLMVETSDWLTPEEVDKLVPLDDVDWKQALRHELDMKMKLGEARSYIPVVSGMPGIGKTTVFKDIAKEKDMGFIQVDVSNLTPEDISGMPIADTSKGDDNITTEFSEPNLYITIMKEYNEIIENVRQDGRPYNVVLLFDELNRTEVPVFNSIRQVLLEKTFGELKLPTDVMITGAINPVDIGAIEFTSHTRDVLDIIPSAQSFTKLFEYIRTKEQLVSISENMGWSVVDAVANTMAALAQEFKSEVDNDAPPKVLHFDEQPFWWDIGNSIFYISGREMTEAIALAVSQIEDNFDDMNWDREEDYSDKQKAAFIKEALNTTAKSFTATFKMVALKQDIEEFTKLMGIRITSNEKYRMLFNEITTAKGVNEVSLQDKLQSANGDIQFLDKGVVGQYLAYTSPSEFTQDVSSICQAYIEEFSNSNDTLDKVIELTLRLNKSLTSNDKISNEFNNNLIYQSRRVIRAILEDSRFDLKALLKNDATLRKLDKIKL